jgi:hypothetical protein
MKRHVFLRKREPAFDPGAPEAVAEGCTCDPVRNAHGKGWPMPGIAGLVHSPDPACPLHGIDAVMGLPDERVH